MIDTERDYDHAGFLTGFAAAVVAAGAALLLDCDVVVVAV